MSAFQAYVDSLPNAHIIILTLVLAMFTQKAMEWAWERGWYWQSLVVAMTLMGILIGLMWMIPKE